MAARANTQFNLTGAGEPEVVRGALVTANYFRVLGAPIPVGRGFRDEEERRGAPRVAMLSDGFWRRDSAAAPTWSGRRITLDGVPYTIVGAGARGLSVPQDVDVWSPVPDRHHPGPPQRLSRGARPARAGRRPASRAGGAGDDRPAAGARPTRTATAAGASSWWACRSASWARSGPALLVFMGAVGLVLLIACANVANLHARAGRGTGARDDDPRGARGLAAPAGPAAAHGERGARRSRAARSDSGSRCGAFARCRRSSRAPFPRLDEIGVERDRARLRARALGRDGAALRRGAGRTRLMRYDLRGRARGRRARDGGAPLGRPDAVAARAGRGGAGVRAARRRGAAAHELRPAAAGRSRLRAGGHPDGPRDAAAGPLRRSGATGGVRRGAARAGAEPARASARRRSRPTRRWATVRRYWAFAVAGVEQPPPEVVQDAVVFRTTPDYFRTFAIPAAATAGCTTASDRGDAAPVALVSEALARRYWPDRSPLGARITFGDPTDTSSVWLTVVGVVGDVRQEGPAGAAYPQLYVPLAQLSSRSLLIALRTSGDPLALTPAVKRAVSGHRRQPRARPRGDDGRAGRGRAGASAGERAAAGGLRRASALVLAALGHLRRHRLQRGAADARARHPHGARRPAATTCCAWCSGRAWRRCSRGLALGLGGAAAASRVLRGLLYGVGGTDPITYAGVATFLAAVALLASYLPARRAATGGSRGGAPRRSRSCRSPSTR